MFSPNQTTPGRAMPLQAGQVGGSEASGAS
jgi:hypothetical protein